jgi:hypothetical protein
MLSKALRLGHRLSAYDGATEHEHAQEPLWVGADIEHLEQTA